MTKNITLKMLLVGATFALTSQGVMAGDGTSASPFTVAEALVKADALTAEGETSDTLWVTADLLGYGTDTTSPAETLADSSFVLGQGSARFVAQSKAIAGGLVDAVNKAGLLVKGVFKFTGGNRFFAVNQLHNAMTLTVDASGFRTFHFGSRYVLPQGLQITSVNVPNAKSTNKFVRYEWKEAGTVVDAGGAYLIRGEAGTYPLVLTADAASQISFSTALYAGVVGSNARKNRIVYKWVSADGQIGFIRDTTDGSTVTFTEKHHCYLAVPQTSLDIMIAAGAATADGSFLYYSADGVTDIATALADKPADGSVYSLQGQKMGQAADFDALPAGVYIVNGKKVVK